MIVRPDERGWGILTRVTIPSSRSAATLTCPCVCGEEDRCSVCEEPNVNLGVAAKKKKHHTQSTLPRCKFNKSESINNRTFAALRAVWHNGDILGIDSITTEAIRVTLAAVLKPRCSLWYTDHAAGDAGSASFVRRTWWTDTDTDEQGRAECNAASLNSLKYVSKRWIRRFKWCLLNDTNIRHSSRVKNISPTAHQMQFRCSWVRKHIVGRWQVSISGYDGSCFFFCYWGESFLWSWVLWLARCGESDSRSASL